MADTSDDSGPEWYEEPVTIVGFVAGFLLLVLVIASMLILCYSREEEEEDEKEEGQTVQREAERQQMGQPRNVHSREEQQKTQTNVPDRTNPLYTSANEFRLQPFPYSLRAKFVHIHIDEETSKGGFQAYYDK